MKLLCLLLYITYVTCFHITQDLTIKENVLGRKVKRVNKVSHQAAFEYDGRFKSSATIISSTWLISVAHVFVNCYDIEIRGKIRIGTQFKESGGSLFRIKKVIPHPDFDLNTLNNNLILIELFIAIQFSKNQKPVYVAEPHEDDITGIKMRIAQLRHVEEATTESSKPKLLHVRVTTEDVCRNAYPNAPKDKIFCTTRLDDAVCNRDYGGGTVFYAYLFGIITTVNNCEPNSPPDMHIKLSEYYSWISQTAILATEV